MHDQVNAQIRQKWRPPLALVLGGVLGAVLCLPMIGFLMLRGIGPMMGWGEAFVMLGFGILGITLLLGWLLWRLLVRPLNGLVDRAARLKQGDARAADPLPHYGTPELQRLGQSVLDLADVLQNRADSLRQYSDHVTHELKSPLTTLQGASEMLRSARDPAEVAQLADLITQSTLRMDQLLEGMRKLAASRTPLQGPDCCLSDLDLTAAPIKIDTVSDHTLPISQPALQMIIDHLARNAAEHGAAHLQLAASNKALRIQDDGQGISEGNLARVFDPFFTTKRDVGGTGMGLAIVAGVVQGQGGQIRAVPTNKGATFILTF